MDAPNDTLESVANRIARETMEVWEIRVQYGQETVVETHQKSFSALARAGVRVGDHSVIEYLSDLTCEVGIPNDENERVRKAAVQALGKVGIPSPAVLEVLSKRLENDKARAVREAAAEALGRINTDDPEVIESLIDLFEVEGQRHNSVVKTAAKTLSSNPVVVESLIENLKSNLKSHDLPGVRATSAETLGWIDTHDSEVIETLIDQLDDEDSWVRSSVWLALGMIDPSDLEIKFFLNWLEREEDLSVCQSIIFALGKINISDPKVIVALIERLDGDLREFNAAALTLGKIGKSNPAVINALLSKMEHDAAFVRGTAAEALGQIGTTDSAVIETLIDRLNDEDENVRAGVIEALGEIAAHNPSIVDQSLVKMLATRVRDEDSGVRKLAVEALGKIGHSAPSILEVSFSRHEASFADIKTSVPEVLLSRLKDVDEDSDVRNSAAEALGKIGQFNSRIMEELASNFYHEGSHAAPITRTLHSLPWHVFSETQLNEEVLERLAEVQKDRSEGQGVVQTEDGEHLLIHWQALARLPE